VKEIKSIDPKAVNGRYSSMEKRAEREKGR
jgi:hypothetical protein